MTPRLLAFVVFSLTLLVHVRAVGGSFVFHDDLRYVVNNQAIDEVGNPLRFFTDLGTLSPESPTKDIYRPVRTLSYAVITALWGKESARPLHWLAILLHAGTTALLLLLLLRAGLGRFAAAAGALFFGLHPLTVEVTAWVCSLGDAWCGFLAILSVLLYAADRRILALLAMVIALFSKEHAVVVPGLWLAWDWCTRPERLRRGAWLLTVLRGAAPAGVLVLGFLFFRNDVVGAKMSQVGEPIGGSVWSATCTMIAGLGWYATTVLLPYRPTFDAVVDVRDTLLDPGVYLGLLVLAALVWAVVRGSSRVRLGALWFLVALVPVHNIFVPLKIPTADRFLYLPLMGLSFVVGELADRTAPFARKWMTPALALLGILTVARIGDWKSSENLVKAGLRVAPKSYRLIWAEAAIDAQKVARYLHDGDIVSARRLGGEAVKKYDLYLRNSNPAEQTQVYVELGNLLYELGRVGGRDLWQDAFAAYAAAYSLQARGIGRYSEEEIRHVAERIVQLAVNLVPRSDSPGDLIEMGLMAANFRKKKYGIDDTGVRIVFRLADSIRARGQHPEEARKGFDWVLDKVAELEAKGAHEPFARAQARFFRAILKDQDYDRRGIERAYDEYLEAARDPVQTLRALAYAGRCKCTIGLLFGDEQATEEGKRLLAAIPGMAAEKRLPLDDQLRSEIQSLEANCGR